MRVLEIGCGSGAAARLVSELVAPGLVVAVDRSKKSLEIARRSCEKALGPGRIQFVLCSVEDLHRHSNLDDFDLAFAMRVGVLDGRHPEQMPAALGNIARLLRPSGRLFVDDGSKVREIDPRSVQ